MLAVVPVKGRDGAKTRLAPLLEPEERTRLVLDMLERVLEACAGAESITGTLLVTPDPGFAPRGVELLRDAGTGHADAIALALRDERALAGALVVMADCPFVRPQSLDVLAAAAKPLALAPSRVITPGFTWGRSPVSARTCSHMRARYSIVVSQPSSASSSRAAR